LIDDLADFIAPSVENKAEDLHTVWQENLDQLNSDEANEEITNAIKTTRTSLKEAIQNLH
jgi:ethanolamine utilization protein EutA (predicted chaperonin)